MKVRGHGTSRMPVWGMTFSLELGAGHEDDVRVMIDALADHVMSLQKRSRRGRVFRLRCCTAAKYFREATAAKEAAGAMRARRPGRGAKLVAKELSRHLTAVDSAFLYFEKKTESMHIGSCMIYEGRMPKEELVRLLEERMHLAPRYRQRVVFPPFASGHPFWLDDPEFDIQKHVDEVELDGPATREALSVAVADAYSGNLPRSRPLWSATLIHGLPGDNTAVVWRVHHAMIDGVSGVDLTMALNSFSPDDAPPAPPGAPFDPEPLPDSLSLMQEAFRERLSNASRVWTDAFFDGIRPERVTRRFEQMREAAGPTLPKLMRMAPRTRFNKRVSGKLAWAWRELSFTEVRKVKSVLGGPSTTSCWPS